MAFLALWAIVDLVRIQGDLSDGQRILKSAGAKDLGNPGGVAAIATRAQNHLKRGRSLARTSLPLILARPLPLLGQQVAALRHMTQTAAEVGSIGTRAANAIQHQLDAGAGGGGGARVALIDTVVNQLRAGREDLRHIKVAHDAFVLPPFRQARSKLEHSLTSAATKLDDGLRMTTALQRMMVGRSRYLILAANNAEMRAGGMPLSAGVAEISDGKITMGTFAQTGDLWRKESVDVLPNLKNLYSWMGMGQEWRATTATPNFPRSGPMYASMSPHSGLGPVDGVILVDVLALKAVMQATGPVIVDGNTYTTANIAQQLLNQNYLLFGDTAAHGQRSDLQSAIGTAIFESLNSRPLKLGSLVSNLSDAGKGRHLLAWSRDPDMEEVWLRAGISGAVPENGFMVNLQNISANKLDWYIHPTVALRTLDVKGKYRRVQLSVTFTNAPRDPTSPAIEGVDYAKTHGMLPGQHRAYLVVYLPKPAFDIVTRDPPFVTAGVDAGMNVVGVRYAVDLGATRTISINFSVPKNQVFILIPSARAAPVVVALPKHNITDALPAAFKL